MDCKSIVDSGTNVESRSVLDSRSDMDCRPTVDSNPQKSLNISLFTFITHDSSTLPRYNPDILDAEEEARRVVAQIYEEDRRVMQKHRDHSMNNKVCAPNEVRLDNAPLSMDFLSKVSSLQLYSVDDIQEERSKGEGVQPEPWYHKQHHSVE